MLEACEDPAIRADHGSWGLQCEETTNIRDRPRESAISCQREHFTSDSDPLAVSLPNFPLHIPGRALMSFGEWRGTRTKMVLLGALLTHLPTIYGGIHLLALYFTFPTTVEHHLWMSSCVAIMSTPAIIIFHVTIVYPLRWLFLCTRTDMRTCFKSPFLVRLCHCYFKLSVLIYVLARVYLVVESFISLRDAPIGAYLEIPWTQNIPHV